MEEIKSPKKRVKKLCAVCGKFNKHSSYKAKQCGSCITGLWKATEKGSNYFAKYRTDHKEELAEYCRKWREENPKYYEDYWGGYYEENIEKVRSRGRRYRAIKSGVVGSHTLKQWLELRAKCKGICPCCKKKRKLTEDHIIPLTWKGSSDDISNIQPLCGKCNTSKGNHHATKYI